MLKIYLVTPYFLKWSRAVAIVNSTACRIAKMIWGRYGAYIIAIPIATEWRLK